MKSFQPGPSAKLSVAGEKKKVDNNCVAKAATAKIFIVI